MEQWAEIRRMHFVAAAVDQGDLPAHGPQPGDGPPGAALARGRRATSARPVASKLDPHKEEIHRLLRRRRRACRPPGSAS